MNKLRVLLLACLVAGLADAVYLWTAYATSAPILCASNGCDLVRMSPYSHVFGISFPVLGSLMYGSLLSLVLVHGAVKRMWSSSRLRVAALVIAGLGLAVSGYLTWVEAFRIHAFCLWCLISAGLTLVSFVLICTPGVWTASSPNASTRVQHDLTAIGFLVVVFVPMILAARQSTRPLGTTHLLSDSAVQSRLLPGVTHWYGDSHAPVTIIEFADLQCPGCKQTEPLLLKLVDRYRNRVRLGFRNLPLSTVHPDAEDAAEACECAAEQGRFWQAIKTLYANQNDLSRVALDSYAARMGLQQSQFLDCLRSGRMRPRIRRDVADAEVLGIKGTPTLIVDQTEIDGPVTYARLVNLVDRELRAKGISR